MSSKGACEKLMYTSRQNVRSTSTDFWENRESFKTVKDPKELLAKRLGRDQVYSSSSKTR